MIRLLELFGGIGACSAALDRLGIDHEIADYVEIDRFAVQSYNAIHGTDFEPQDITAWDKDIPVDMIMHGSPCQDFSVAGKNAGGDEGSGTRSSLMYETLRIVGRLKPKYVVWENVKNVLSEKHRHNFDRYLGTMEGMGYENHYKVLNAKHYGVPQNRERVFCVSIHGGGDFEFPEPFPLELRLKDLLEAEVDEKYYLSDEQVRKIRSSNYNHQAGRIQDGDLCRTLTARDWRGPVCVQVGQMYGTEREPNPQAGRVYSAGGISPTMDSCSGGNRMPKVLVSEATKKGYAEAREGDSINLEQPNSTTRRGKAIRKQYEAGEVRESRHNMTEPVPREDGISNTLTTVLKDNYVVEPYIAASRGRNPENPSDRTAGCPTEQRLEPKFDGTTNTITTVLKDNYVVEPTGAILFESEKFGGLKVRNDGCSPTLRAEKVCAGVMEPLPSFVNGDVSRCVRCGGHGSTDRHSWDMVQCESTLRIRKLTPKECWRLMGFADGDFEKARAVCSNTQLYKQAGNSIVVDVLKMILENLLTKGE